MDPQTQAQLFDLQRQNEALARRVALLETTLDKVLDALVDVADDLTQKNVNGAQAVAAEGDRYLKHRRRR